VTLINSILKVQSRQPLRLTLHLLLGLEKVWVLAVGLVEYRLRLFDLVNNVKQAGVELFARLRRGQVASVYVLLIQSVHQVVVAACCGAHLVELGSLLRVRLRRLHRTHALPDLLEHLKLGREALLLLRSDPQLAGLVAALAQHALQLLYGLLLSPLAPRLLW
jgi:hypothetical protein